MTTKQLSDGGSDGVKLGQSSTDKVGFYGATPAVRPTCTLAAALTAGETTPEDIAAAVDEIHAALATRH
jgi:hypothetical protein